MNKYRSITIILNATLTIDNNIVASDLINYSPSLLMSDSIITHNFNTTWTATPGFHKACVYTDNPNLSLDYSLADDTICRTILVFDSVTTTSLPYCNDFESGTQWVTLDAISYSQATSFQLGSPNQAFLNTAHSGQKVCTRNIEENKPEES